MSLIGSAITFAVSLLVGGLAIFIAAAVVTGTRDYGHAVFTALVGAIVWGLTALFLVGPADRRLPPASRVGLGHPGALRGLVGSRGVIGFIAWASAVLVLAVLPFGGVTDAVGVPFVRSLGAI